MTIGCKNTCKKYYPKKCNVQHHWVEKGYKKCVTCSFNIKTDDLCCKCCGYRFRKSLRNSNSLTYYHTISRPHRILENGFIQTRTRQQHKEKKRI